MLVDRLEIHDALLLRGSDEGLAAPLNDAEYEQAFSEYERPVYRVRLWDET